MQADFDGRKSIAEIVFHFRKSYKLKNLFKLKIYIHGRSKGFCAWFIVWGLGL